MTRLPILAPSHPCSGFAIHARKLLGFRARMTKPWHGWNTVVSETSSTFPAVPITQRSHAVIPSKNREISIRSPRATRFDDTISRHFYCWNGHHARCSHLCHLCSNPLPRASLAGGLSQFCRTDLPGVLRALAARSATRSLSQLLGESAGLQQRRFVLGVCVGLGRLSD